MPVIAGRRAEEFDRVQLAPRLFRVQKSMCKRLGNGVVHERQRCIAADEALLGLAAENIGKQPLGGHDAAQLAVVAHVHAVDNALCRVGQHGQNIADHVQLCLGGLAARHVELQLLCLEFIKMRLDLAISLFQLLLGKIFVSSTHSCTLPFFSSCRARRRGSFYI